MQGQSLTNERKKYFSMLIQKNRMKNVPLSAWLPVVFSSDMIVLLLYCVRQNHSLYWFSGIYRFYKLYDWLNLLCSVSGQIFIFLLL